jgi:peptidoglycan hydrolase-like protein with peptidoglycan-binding domain
VRNRGRRDRTSIEAAGTLGGAIARHPREFVGITMAAVATLAIFVNALFLQHGPHPAPIFATRSLTQREAALPPHRPVVPQAVPAAPISPARSQAHVTSDIQRELARRGFYDGTVDGIWGSKTDAAARDFVQAAGLKLNPEPSESLLRALAAAPTKTAKSRATAPAPVAASAPARKDAIATMIAPDKRVLAVQRALADFGYGQIRPTGVYDQDTRAAIEKFQRDHRLPVDGRMSDRFVRELAAMTGRPLE